MVRPPGVCPHNLKVGDYYQQYLLEVWDIVTQNSNIKKNAGQISLELANEPVSVKNANGQDDAKALHDYFQPIVDKIRENGFTGIIWMLGYRWQANYADYASSPLRAITSAMPYTTTTAGTVATTRIPRHRSTKAHERSTSSRSKAGG